jgi:S-DNA-T family DNA segregation ATPase FtsK/SpoIIIE
MLTAMRVSVPDRPRWDVRRTWSSTPTTRPHRRRHRRLLAVLASPALDQADVIPLTARTAAAPERRTHTLYHHGEPLDTSLPLAESGLKEGSLLSLDDPTASIVVEPDGLVEIRVVSGPGAGAVHRLTAGDATIGSDPSCVLPLPDDRLPAVCLLVSVGHDGATTVSPVDGETPVALDREGLADGDTTWPVGGQLVLGDYLLELEGVSEPDAAVEDSPEPGWLDYNRPPRLHAPDRQTTFRLPNPPSEQARTGLPWLVMLLPLVLAVVMALVLDRWYMLMFGIFSPVMMLGSYLQTKKQGKLTYRQQLAEYRDRKARIEADVEQALVDERLALRMAAPDPALALLVAHGPRARLWERRPDDPDYLSLRIGVGDLPSEVTVRTPSSSAPPQDGRTAYDVR